MKDMPALLTASLSVKDRELLRKNPQTEVLPFEFDVEYVQAAQS